MRKCRIDDLEPLFQGTGESHRSKDFCPFQHTLRVSEEIVNPQRSQSPLLLTPSDLSHTRVNYGLKERTEDLKPR